MSKGQVHKEHNDMGMAASQARLLCLTARIHDIEYQAQSIQNAKLQLAIQSDRAYDEYNQALAETTLTINALDLGTGKTSIIAANFNNLCSRNRVVAANGQEYALRNKNGLLIVEDEIEKRYTDFVESGFTKDPFIFAMYMLGEINSDEEDFEEKLTAAEEDITELAVENGEAGQLGVYREAMNKILDKYLGEDAPTYYYAYVLMNSLNEQDGDKDAAKDAKEYEKLEKLYRAELYKRYPAEILAKATDNEGNSLTENTGKELFDYYVSIFKQIQACGGCVSIDDYNGKIDGETSTNHLAANDTEWLQGMIQSGYFSIEIIETDEDTGNVRLNRTSPSSDSVISYTTTTTIDNTALAKAEAEYEHTLRQIDKKDQKFDLDLSKLETERTALTKEYDSVKKVIQENIDRTFGIFS